MITRYIQVTSQAVLILAILTCEGPITYKLEIAKGPVQSIAEDRGSYTRLAFFAYNDQVDFAGYEISTGASLSESEAFTNPVFCELIANSNTGTKPTQVQLGGSEITGYDCFISSTGPLAPGTWVSVRSKRNCQTNKGDTSDVTHCSDSMYSEPASSKVLDYISPPSSISIQSVTGSGNETYYRLNVTISPVPAGLTGTGLFYSSPLSPANDNAEEAWYKASRNGNIRDGFCNNTVGGTIIIQIGGTQGAGVDCYIGNFYLNTGDTIAIRNSVDRPDFPWSDFVSVTVP